MPAPRPADEIVRYEEDWSRLVSEEDRTDPFDALKNRSLGKGWRLTAGGSARIRFEADGNKTLGASPRRHDEVLKGRTYLHVELRHAKSFRWFAEVRAAEGWGSERPEPVLDHDHPDFQNFFLEATMGSSGTRPVLFRVGRQELRSGAERLISPLDWSGTRRTFDGLSVVARTPRSRTQVCLTRPVDHEPHEMDSPVNDRFLHGVDWTWRFREGHLVEPYLFWLVDQRGLAVDENTGEHGDVSRRTWGVRYQYDRSGWIGETEWSYQEGEAADDPIDAWSISMTGARQWKDIAWKPKLSVGLDVATGDSDPADGSRGRFDQLYPLGHAYLGHIDLVARENVRAARVQVDLTPRTGVQWTLALHRFELDEKRDALHSAGGARLRHDATGKSGRDVALELDALASWKISSHHRVSAEICRWWSGSFVERTGLGDDAWLLWAAYEVRF